MSSAVLNRIKGLDTLMTIPGAVSLKFIPEPLSQSQLSELIQIQGEPGRVRPRHYAGGAMTTSARLAIATIVSLGGTP